MNGKEEPLVQITGVLTLPKKQRMFNLEKFFDYYRDPMIDRERKHALYLARKNGTEIIKYKRKK